MRQVVIFLSSFIVIGSALAPEPNPRVFRLDGSLQCGMGKARTLLEDRRSLEQLGAAVISEEKRVVPTAIIAVCGAPTGSAKTYVVSAADSSKILSGFVGPAGFTLGDLLPATPATCIV